MRISLIRSIPPPVIRRISGRLKREIKFSRGIYRRLHPRVKFANSGRTIPDIIPDNRISHRLTDRTIRDPDFNCSIDPLDASLFPSTIDNLLPSPLSLRSLALVHRVFLSINLGSEIFETSSSVRMEKWKNVVGVK